MNVHRNGTRRGFTLVELLAVVMILGVLAAVAVPLYINSRKAAAARTCKANITAIASAESAFALRNGAYCLDTANTTATGSNYVAAAPLTGGLVGAPEGVSGKLYCPLDNTSTYTVTATAGVAGGITITCPNSAAHAAVVPGQATDYVRTMAPPAAEGIP